MTDLNLFDLPIFDYQEYLKESPDNFVIGFDLAKATDATEQDWLIDGIASCGMKDQDEEELVQKGINFSPFQEKGYINWDHKDRNSPAYIIGQPHKADLVPLAQYANQLSGPVSGMGLYVKGELYKNKPVARAVWEHMQALEQVSGKAGKRRLGWSVQGRVLERDPLNKSKILQCVVHHVAVTHQPVNQFTFASLAKSMTTISGEPLAVENLHGKQGHPLTSTLFGACQEGQQCYDRQRRFFRREHGALDHMVKCRGSEVGDAMDLVKTLRNGGYRF